MGVAVTRLLGSGSRGGNLCSCVGFVLCQLVSIRLYRSTLTQHIY